MPLTPATVLYALIILAGIFFVIYGMNPRHGSKAPAFDSCRGSSSDAMARPTGDLLTLEFSGREAENTAAREAMEDDVLSTPILPRHVQMEYSSKSSSRFSKSLRALRNRLGRKKDLRDDPVAMGTELIPKERRVGRDEPANETEN